MKARREFDNAFANRRPTDEIVDIFIPARAIGKERPRSYRTPEKTRNWIYGVARIAAETMQELGIKAIDRPVCCRYIIAFHEGRYPDIDNIEKALFEALQRGDKSKQWQVVTDDKHFRGYVEKCEVIIPDNQEPYLWVRIYEQPELCN